MKPHIKAISTLAFFAISILGLRAADLPIFEFLGDLPNKKEVATLVFDVKEILIGTQRSHTVFAAKAVVVKSGLKELESGTEFMALFDKFYSIFDVPQSHPLKPGDRVEIGITSLETENHWVSGYLKKIESNEQPEPPKTNGDSSY